MYCEVKPKEFRDIIQSNIIQQTAFWARVKKQQGIHPFAFSFKAKEILTQHKTNSKTVYDDILILLQYIDNEHCIAYAPYGPKGEPNEEKQGKLLEELSEILRPHLPSKCILIRYDLPWENLWSKEEDYFDEHNNWTGPPTVQSQEMRLNFNTKKWNLYKTPTDVLPSNTIFLNLNNNEEQLLGDMKAKTRYNIRLSQRRGVTVKTYSMNYLDDWYKLYSDTAARNGITLHSKKYFQTVFQTRTNDLASPADVRLLMADYKNEHLAAMFLILSKNRGTYLYGASSDKHRNLMATYALQWEAIKQSKQAGCTEYDLFGSAPNANTGHPMHGLYRFKSGFGGKMFHRMGCWDYPFDMKKYELLRAQEVNNQKYHKNL
ncbi:MAG: peptidoglycan bridge formation glycyltransferase FemA/FemB family protein [Prolixibacteraceae bacterium]|jgi:hypothetical protein|nr:peptidoglycan bridge formation glycyltransferase FemA/FemB family protein [Prolixibacteraceae bacterium]